MIAPAISTLPAGMGQQVLVVEPYEVERGDRLFGLRTPVDHLLYDGGCGRWLYVDAAGLIIARRRPADRVQVVRGGLSTHDCNPYGLPRPELRLVRGGAA